MPHYSYLCQDYYYWKDEVLAIIDLVDIDRRERRTNEAKVYGNSEAYLSTTFKEDVIEMLKEKSEKA